MQRSESELNAIPNFGERSTEEVIEALHGLGSRFGDGVGRLQAPRRRIRDAPPEDTAQAQPRRSHRKALMRNLWRELIQHERIQTSQAKAKAVKPEVEKLITLAKRGDLHARRRRCPSSGRTSSSSTSCSRRSRPATRSAPAATRGS